MKKIFCALLGALLVATAAADTAIPLSQFPKSQLQIATPDARLHPFNIWIAQDEVHQEQGLMYIKDLPNDAGMLFIYPTSRKIRMWMKNTLIPLDMIFFRADGRVANIAANTKPLSLDTIESDENVVAVLEVKGGTAVALNIRKGALAIHPFFGTAK
jgi:uncharacterized membrane protein (UPF0127 family)